MVLHVRHAFRNARLLVAHQSSLFQFAEAPEQVLEVAAWWRRATGWSPKGSFRNPARGRREGFAGFSLFCKEARKRQFGFSREFFLL